ncbi:MAG: hypothetical protein AAGD38_21930, partial [Acidobacteriota bacterium]
MNKRDRMNEDICPKRFRIVVPKHSRLLGPVSEPNQWKTHLERLAGDGEVPPEHYENRDPKNDPVSDFSCDCKEGWVLYGDLAVEHARLVHDKIHRQVLALDQVGAMDVGFAISERETRFLNILSLRVHVNKKRSPEQLLRAGLVNLARASYALTDFATGLGAEPGDDGLRGKDSFLDLPLYDLSLPDSSARGCRAAEPGTDENVSSFEALGLAQPDPRKT